MIALRGCKKSSKGIPSAAAGTSVFMKSEADSMAIVLLKNCNISFNASIFSAFLESADNEYLQHLRQPLRAYFTAYQLLFFEDNWSSPPFTRTFHP